MVIHCTEPWNCSTFFIKKYEGLKHWNLITFKVVVSQSPGNSMESIVQPISVDALDRKEKKN